VQHALLGLAIAFILAIAAALAAPAFVNWGDWRANFESRATVLAGAPVRIRGKIEAKLLPTPAFLLREVDIGDPENGTGARVGEVRGVLSLGALLRGVFEAEEFALVRPAARVALGSGPASHGLRTAAAATGLVALSRVSIERGSLVIDRGGELTILDDIYAEGEMRSRAGPMRIDAVFRRDSRRWGLKANLGQLADNRGRMRLTLEHAGAGTMFDADGTISFAGATPRFEGKLIAGRRAAPGVPWLITANAKATEQSVLLESFELSLGANAVPAELTGRVEFEPRRGGKLDGSLSARRIDLDLTAGGEGAKGLPASFASLREVLALLDQLPLRGRIGLSVDLLAAAGGTIREVKAEIGLREHSLALERLEAKLPGKGLLSASGASEGDAFFLGDAKIVAEDATAFARWAFGDKSLPSDDAGSLLLAGKVDWRNGRARVDGLTFALGEAKLGGNLTLEPGAGGKRTRVEANLTADGADLDILRPAAEWLRGNSGSADISLGVQGNALKVLGRPLRRIDAALSRTSEGLAIERLSLEDFDGLSFNANGRIAAPIERPSGKIEFDLSTTRPDGLATIVQELFGEDSARLTRHVAGSGSALKLTGTATGAGSAAGVEVNANGTLGDIETTAAASFDLLTESLSEAHVTLEAREPKSLAVLLGISPGLPSAGNGVLEIDFSKPAGGALPVNAKLSVPGAEILAEGELRGTNGRLDPNFNVTVAASDLRVLLAAAAQTGGDAPIGANGSFRLAHDSDGLQFQEIALKIAGASVSGALSASEFTKPQLGGKLAIERMEIASLLALAVGSAREGKTLWPTDKIAPAPLSKATGAIEFDVAALGLLGRRDALNTKFRLRLGPTTAAIEEFSGELAGGKLAGSASFVRGETLAFDGRASFEGFDVAKLVAPDGKSEIRGRGQMTLSVAGSGATPAALASSLAGQGTIALENLEIDRAEPGAVAAVYGGEEAEARDEIAVIAALAPALARGPLKVAKIDAPIVVAGGNARTGKARATIGATQVALEMSFDIARLVIDASAEMEIAPPGSTIRPAATVRWRGPLTAVERGVEAAALATAITLRAMERETKRIEERDRALPRLQPRTEQPAPQNNPVASVPSIAPPDPDAPPITVVPRVPAPTARPRVIEPQRNALPPLPPATDIRPFSVYPPQN